MKLIDLLNKIANGEEVPKKIKFQNVLYEYDRNRKEYIHEIEEFCSETLLFNVMYCHFINEILEAEVEVIEDEEIDIRELKETELKKDGRLEYFEYENNGATESGYSKNYSTCDIETRKIMNEIIRVVKQHEKEIEELKSLDVEISEQEINKAINKARERISEEKKLKEEE